MCGGVTSGSAGMKFSGSFSRLGASVVRDIKTIIKIVNPNISLSEKYG